MEVTESRVVPEADIIMKNVADQKRALIEELGLQPHLISLSVKGYEYIIVWRDAKVASLVRRSMNETDLPNHIGNLKLIVNPLQTFRAIVLCHPTVELTYADELRQIKGRLLIND